MYLTHRDDVADHDKFQQRFNCQRILHQDDIQPDTQGVEIKLSGTDTVELTPDLQIITVPGHSRGHTVLLYQNKFLFAGDPFSLVALSQPTLCFSSFLLVFLVGTN